MIKTGILLIVLTSTVLTGYNQVDSTIQLQKSLIYNFIDLMNEKDSLSIKYYLEFFDKHSEMEEGFRYMQCKENQINLDTCDKIIGDAFRNKENSESTVLKKVFLHLSNNSNEEYKIRTIKHLISKDCIDYFEVKLDNTDDVNVLFFIISDFTIDKCGIEDILDDYYTSIIMVDSYSDIYKKLLLEYFKN